MRKSYLLICVGIIIILLLILTNTYKAVFSTIASYLTPVDNNYIIEKGEWIGEKYGKISLYDKSDSLAYGIIYKDKKPIYKITRLNKYFNEFVAVRLENDDVDIFICTEELTR